MRVKEQRGGSRGRSLESGGDGGGEKPRLGQPELGLARNEDRLRGDVRQAHSEGPALEVAGLQQQRTKGTTKEIKKLSLLMVCARSGRPV